MALIYRSLNDYCRERFHHKLYKLSLDGGFTCPNRDGTLDTRGCIFCSAGGSGDFAVPLSPDSREMLPPPRGLRPSPDEALSPCISPASVREQMSRARSLIESKLPKNGDYGFIAYFQAFTGTYAPAPRLRELYHAALSFPGVEVLSLATRPDCLPDEVLDLLEEINRTTPVWVELGLQTIHPATARYIRRGYDLPCFEEAVRKLRARGIEVIVHTILGLPGEREEDILATMDYLAGLDIQGIKLQLLHVLRGTDLADDYERGAFTLPSREEYLQLVCRCLEHLPPDLVIHRLTGDGPRRLLIAPLWSLDKKRVRSDLERLLREAPPRGR